MLGRESLIRRCARGLVLTRLLFAALNAVASPSSSPPPLLDDTQQPLRLAGPAQRVVSLLPSLTETVCALGQCQRLVGVDRYSNWPQAVQALPQVGGGLDPNIESIVRLRPDLVLLAGSTRGADRLQALGIAVLRLEPRTHADVQRVLLTVAQALGVPQVQAQRVWQDMQAQVQAAAQSLQPQARKLRVYVEVSPTPHAASASSFIGQTLHSMGVSNIVPGDWGPFPQINPEWVLRTQPDVVVLGDSSRVSLLQRPGWAQMPALRHGRVCAFSAQQADALVRAGPRMAEGARLMADCLNRVAKH